MSSDTPAQIQLVQVSLAAGLGIHYLLQNISFSVFAGDRIALIGTSGAGKTSLLRLLNRLSDPSEGVIYFNAQAVRDIPVIQLRQQIMLVPQEPKLLGMNVQAALTYPLVLQGAPPNLVKQRLAYWVEQMQIPSDWLERDELRLSLGERQRVAIARALVAEPQILLLDEPTSALDVGRAEAVFQVLDRHPQITLITATHQLDLAHQFCNRILYLNQGELIQDIEVEAVDWDVLRATFSQQAQLAANEWN